MYTHDALTLDTVTVRYGKHIAVDRLSLTVARGEIVGLLGPNGSGKSSTLSAIAGALAPSDGSIRVGRVEHRRSGYAQHVGFVPQSTALYEELSVRRNLEFLGNLYGLHGRTLRNRIETVVGWVCLADRLGDRVGTLSGGMQRRVNLAAAMLHEPDVLLLDEPTVALDPASRDQLFAVLQRFRESGTAILLTTHHLDEAEQWCDRIGILRKGKLLALGTPCEVMRTARTDIVIHGWMREDLSESIESAVRRRFNDSIDWEIHGRRVTLTAPDGERLGEAIAVLHAEGIELESFRTPPTRMERLSCLEEPIILPFPTTEGGSCAA